MYSRTGQAHRQAEAPAARVEGWDWLSASGTSTAAWPLAGSAAAWPFAAWPWVCRSATEDAGWPSVSAWDDPAWQSAWASTYAWAPTCAWGPVYAWASGYASQSRWSWRWARGVAPRGRRRARARDWPKLDGQPAPSGFPWRMPCIATVTVA